MNGSSPFSKEMNTMQIILPKDKNLRIVSEDGKWIEISYSTINEEFIINSEK